MPLWGDECTAVAADYLRKVVQAAPPLTPEQVEQLRALLPAPTVDGEAA